MYCWNEGAQANTSSQPKNLHDAGSEEDGVCMYVSEKGGCGKPASFAIFCGEMPRTLEEGDKQALDWIAGRLSAGHKNAVFRVDVKHARPPLLRTFEPPEHS